MLKKRISVFGICTLISCLMLKVGINSGVALLLMPAVYMTVFAILTLHAGSYLTAITFTVNIVFSLILSKDLFITFLMVPVMSFCGILTGITVAKKFSNMLSVLWGIIATGGVYGLYIIFSIKMLGINPVSDMFITMEDLLSIMSTQVGFDNMIDISEYVDMCRNMFVSVMIIVFSITGFIVSYITSSLLKLFKTEKQLNLSISEFKADRISVFLYFVSLIGALFVKNGMISVMFMNLYLVIQFYLTVCGCSLIYYIIKKKVKAPAIIQKFLGITIFLISVVGVVSTLLIILAIIDARRDFRRINGKEL